MKTIDKLLDELIAREGGYVNHPADRGGPTNWGITEQVARSYGYRGDMRLLTKAAAKDIYRQRYWQRPGFDKVAARYPRLGEELFDTGVNMGPKVAATFLQRVLNVCNRQGSDYPDITADGDIGPMTLHALDGFKRRRGAAGQSALVNGCDALQGARYVEIAERNPSQQAFAYGWLSHRLGQA
jgi:lysozyme family protein